MTSLPKPTFKVPGFDDESHDSSSINNSASLLDQINTFLSSSYSTVDDQNHLIEKIRHEAESNKNNEQQEKEKSFDAFDRCSCSQICSSST